MVYTGQLLQMFHPTGLLTRGFAFHVKSCLSILFNMSSLLVAGFISVIHKDLV